MRVWAERTGEDRKKKTRAAKVNYMSLSQHKRARTNPGVGDALPRFYKVSFPPPYYLRPNNNSHKRPFPTFPLVEA